MTDDALIPKISEDVLIATLPYRKLFCAVLDRCFSDLSSHVESQRVDAVRWLESNEVYPFSYVWLMIQLGLDSKILDIRKALLVEKINYEKIKTALR